MKYILPTLITGLAIIVAFYFLIPEVIERQIRKDCINMHKVQREMHKWQQEDCLAVGVSVNLPIIEK
jgi:hypothetical protein